MSETVNLLDVMGNYVFPVAVTAYLLWERQTSFKAADERWRQVNELLIEVVKQNTATFTRLEATIEKLCAIVNGRDHNGGS